MNVGSLFAGIGGFDLGLERAGMRTVWQVEQEPFRRAVLARHFPDAKRYEDVHDVGARNLEWVDVICGGFPCQPVSVAGHKRGQDDARWLWPDFARIVRELRPRYVIVENVPGLLLRGMGDVLGNLAAIGYDAEWDCLSAAAFGAPHLRDRIWLLAYPDEDRCDPPSRGQERNNGQAQPPTSASGECRVFDLRRSDSGTLGVHAPPLGDARGEGLEGGRQTRTARHANWWATESDVGRVAHGVPDRVDRLAALGDALVPQIAEWLGRRLIEWEHANVADAA